jgi:hypothetical protein
MSLNQSLPASASDQTTQSSSQVSEQELQAQLTNLFFEWHESYITRNQAVLATIRRRNRDSNQTLEVKTEIAAQEMSDFHFWFLQSAEEYEVNKLELEIQLLLASENGGGEDRSEHSAELPALATEAEQDPSGEKSDQSDISDRKITSGEILSEDFNESNLKFRASDSDMWKADLLKDLEIQQRKRASMNLIYQRNNDWVQQVREQSERAQKSIKLRGRRIAQGMEPQEGRAARNQEDINRFLAWYENKIIIWGVEDDHLHELLHKLDSKDAYRSDPDESLEVRFSDLLSYETRLLYEAREEVEAEQGGSEDGEDVPGAAILWEWSPTNGLDPWPLYWID